MRTGLILGILGGLAGLSAAGYGFVIYMVNGLNGTGNPYAGRVGFDLAAFALAIVAIVGAGLVLGRPQLGSMLMIAGSVLGLAAISLFYVNTWYALAVPLCLFGAFLALSKSGLAGASLAVGVAALVVAAVLAVLSYFLAGTIAALAFGLVFVFGTVLLMTRPAWIP